MLFRSGIQIGGNHDICSFGSFCDSRRLGSVDGNDLAGFEKVGTTVNDLAVHADVTVGNKLFCSKNGGSKTAVVNNGLQTHFDAAHQVFVCSSFDTFSSKEGVAELTFCEAVVSFEFLLFLHHFAVGGEFFAFSVFSLKAGGIGTFHAGALCHSPDAVTDTSAKFVFGLSLFHSFFLSR